VYNGRGERDHRNNRKVVYAQNTESISSSNRITIPITPPYLKELNQPLNELGLTIKNYYTTKDLCKVLNINPDTLRSRFRRGYYVEPVRKNGKRVLTLQEVKEIVGISKQK
jgi:hypothetical protein